MSNVPMFLPSAYSTKRGELETKIINFSNKIFENIIFGIFFDILINLIYIYCWYNKKTLIETFIFFYLLFLILHIIIYKFKGNK